MYNSQRIAAIKMDLAEGNYQNHAEACEMREMVREYEDYREYCMDERADIERKDARFEAYWEARYE